MLLSVGLNGLAILAKHRVNAFAIFLFMSWQTYAFGHLDIATFQPDVFYDFILAFVPDLRLTGSGEMFYEIFSSLVSDARLDEVRDLYSVVDPWNDHPS
jgi:hypothetical protein